MTRTARGRAPRSSGARRDFRLVLGLALCAAGCGPVVATTQEATPIRSGSMGSVARVDANALAVARDAWSRLDRTQSTCSAYDYYPEGGARIFGCHLFSLVSFAQITELSRLRPFLSGPHAHGLDYSAASDFGHYNPEFVSWLALHAIPAAADPEFRAATQPLYDRYVRPLAHAMYETHEKLINNPECFDAEQAEYAAAIANGNTEGYVEPWFFFMNEGYCDNRRADYEAFANSGFDGGHNGNVIKTCVGFWLRRSMDGTERQFFQALTTLMETYEGR